MASFYIYDISFFVLFTLFVVLFLVRNRKKKGFKREGWMFMYRTKKGIKAMEWFDKKFHKLLGWTRYVIIAVGYLLMILMIWMLVQSVIQYITEPTITDTIKAPPIAPLIPYFPEIFGMESFFPPFYFTYFLVALAIVALVHEFSHGVFMKYSKTKIKSTGVLFLGPILGAFVEEDKTSLEKRKRKDQMAILGAGVFANLVFAVLFYLIYSLMFIACFSPAGYSFDNYAFSVLENSQISSVNPLSESLVEINVSKEVYYLVGASMIEQLENNISSIVAYTNSPAFNSKLEGRIIGIDNHSIKTYDDFKNVLINYSPGESAVIYTDSKEQSYEIIFSSHPSNNSQAYLGVVNYDLTQSGFKGFLSNLMGIRTGPTYYAPTTNPDLTYFFYHMVWWIMIINFLVALFNMLPLGILDGGRFFYLTIEKFAGSKKAERAYKFAGKLIVAIFISLLLVWLYRILF